MNGKKKTSCLINEWVVCACVCVCESDRMVFIPMMSVLFSFHFFSLLSVTLHHVLLFTAAGVAASQPLPRLLKSDETYLLNCVCHCGIDFSSLFFRSFVFLFPFTELRAPLSWLWAKCHFNRLNKYTSERKNTS